jgi:CHAT domain-containing protein
MRAAWARQRKDLTRKREELERKLSQLSEGFSESRAEALLTPGELRSVLPEGAVLVDFHEYEVREESPSGVRTVPHLVAFVLPEKGEVSRVELGPAEAIERVIESWREGLDSGEQEKPGRELRRRVWDPIAGHLEGAEVVLLSPDGALNRLPFAALPGKEPGTYLLEDRRITYVAAPRRLPAMLGASREEDVESMLLVGDVEYGGVAGASRDPDARRAAGPLRETLPSFGPLPATGGEVRGIREVFGASFPEGKVEVRTGAEATEDAVRARLGRHRWAHLATHGFFAPEGMLSALADRDRGMGHGESETGARGLHPGLLSGIALAGANTGPAGDGDDGILTALEVAGLDLSSLEVVVLSACETGLGEVAGGEGVRGLQRAFQIAGAGTVVTSLWNVPDRATATLMRRFYRNLWVRNMSRVDALREAQLFVLNEGGGEKDVVRGLGIAKTGAHRDPAGRPLPRYWAGFVLSGDWR